jgi:PHD/YefM family antitoxin component YafN of YafNO toxin-antitoxin module
MRETDYLLSNPANAAHLRKSVAELNDGRGEVHELIED